MSNNDPYVMEYYIPESANKEDFEALINALDQIKKEKARATKMTAKLLPSQIMVELRNIAKDCEDSERSPVSGTSTWPKETTVEWQAVELIEQLQEDLDLTQKIARIEIDAKIRYAWALRQIIELKPDEEFGAVPIETAQKIASAALKQKDNE